jgi:hypothetical protein
VSFTETGLHERHRYSEARLRRLRQGGCRSLLSYVVQLVADTCNFDMWYRVTSRTCSRALSNTRTTWASTCRARVKVLLAYPCFQRSVFVCCVVSRRNDGDSSLLKYWYPSVAKLNSMARHCVCSGVHKPFNDCFYMR